LTLQALSDVDDPLIRTIRSTTSIVSAKPPWFTKSRRLGIGECPCSAPAVVLREPGSIRRFIVDLHAWSALRIERSSGQILRALSRIGDEGEGEKLNDFNWDEY
jgi:hypothetical protein